LTRNLGLQLFVKNQIHTRKASIFYPASGLRPLASKGVPAINSETCTIRVYDRAFNWLASTQSAESVQFTRELYDAGSFQIVISARAQAAAALLAPGNIVVINNDGHRSGIVRDFTAEAARGGVHFTVRGDTGSGLTRRRVSLPSPDPSQGGYDRASGPAESVIKHFVNNNLADPADPARKIPGLTVAPDQARGVPVPAQLRFGTLAADIAGICQYARMGYEIYADCTNAAWIMDVIEGADRSMSQSANAPVFFSIKEQNVSDYRYVQNAANYRNVAYCGGQGENETRLIQTVGQAAGLDRFETFIDCGNAAIADLLALGQIKLADFQSVKTLDLTALPRVFVLGRDYFLGDTVTAYIADIGLTLDTRVESVTEIWERAAGYTAQARFGSKVPDIFAVLADNSVTR